MFTLRFYEKKRQKIYKIYKMEFDCNFNENDQLRRQMDVFAAVNSDTSNLILLRGLRIVRSK
jgi:hypothetical protein